MKQRLSSLSIRYFLSYAAVMLAVMGLFIIYIMNSFYQFHSNTILGKYEKSLELIRETNENELFSLSSITNQLANNAAAKPFKFRDEPVKAKALMAELTTFKATNKYLSAIFLHYCNEDFVYSQASSYTTDNFISRAALFDGISPETLLGRLESTSGTEMLPLQNVSGYVFNAYGETLRVIPVLFPFDYRNIYRCGTVLYLLDGDGYDNWFLTMASDSVDVYIMNGDTPITGLSPNKVPLSLAEQKQESVVYEGVKYHVLRIEGKHYPYSYLMLVSDVELSVALSTSVKVMLMVCVLIAALGALLIMRMVRLRMKPIKLLYGMLMDRKPTGNELLEIRDGVQKLIDENAAMNTRMESYETLRRTDFVQSMINGGIHTNDEWLARAEEIDLNVDLPCYCVCILAKPDGSEYDLSAGKLDTLFDETVCGVAAMLDKAILVAFGQSAPALGQWLTEKFEGMKTSEPGLVMAVSGVHTEWRHGPRAYLEADYAFESRFLVGNRSAILFRNQAENHLSSAAKEKQKRVVEQLRQALSASDALRVSEALTELSHMMRDINLSLFAFRCVYNDILLVITDEADQETHDAYNLFRLSHCLSLEELDRYLRAVCSDIIKKKTQSGESAPSEAAAPEIAHAMALIRQRFSDPSLSVSWVAQEVGMTDSKLSLEFKRCYHVTPFECLTAHRMRRACRLLITSEMPVKDIAVECGYYEIPSFNRRFKAYTGMTPQQYRQNRNGE